MLSDISSSLLLDQIGETQTIPIAVKDLKHRFVYANDAFCKVIGVSRSTLIGKNDLEAGRSPSLVLGDPATGWAGFWALDDQAINGDCSSVNIENTSVENRAAETLRTPLRNDKGQTVALLVQLRYFSELHELKRRVASNLDAISIRDGEITTMDSVLATLMACQDTNTLLSQVTDVLVERTRADSACVATVQESGELMEIVAATGIRADDLLGVTFKRNVGIMGRAWHLGKSVFIDDVAKVHSLYSYRSGTQAFSVPLYVDDAAIAALTVTSDPESPDLSKDIQLLERIGGMASIAIANTHLIDATKRTLRGTHALAEVSQLLPTLTDSTVACNAVCRTMLTAVEATRASVYLIDSNGELNLYNSLVSSEHGVVNRAATTMQSLIRSSIVQWSADTGQCGLIGRLDEDPRESTAVHSARSRMNIGSTCSLPLKKQGEIIGAMVISRHRCRRNFSEAEVDLFKTIVNQLSTFLDRLELANELQHQAFHDRLTGLPNRHSFEAELEHFIVQAKNQSSRFSVLFIDLDGFKEVNDSHGHAVGDQLLAGVAKRLLSIITNNDMLARVGGDEFAAILRSNTDGLELADGLLACLNREFLFGNIPLRVGASIGISRYPENGQTASELLQSADFAMYQAKRRGKGGIFTFNESLAIQSRKQLKLEQELNEAIYRQEFRLVYQPQVRCDEGKVVGFEALIRWHNPIRGEVQPNVFIPIAESTGLINQIGAWVIDEAVRQLAEWQSTIVRDLRVCVNIAAPQFQQAGFCDQVLDALKRYSVPPELLELEVTESVVMHDIKSVVARLERLRNAGVRIAIDDFGTGYSSLSYLQDLPLDVLKIDRSFINRLFDHSGQNSLVNTILLLAEGLGLETVAEGVELPEQRDEIMRLGCNIIQGYLYSRPIPAADIASVVTMIQSQPYPNSRLRRVK